MKFIFTILILPLFFLLSCKTFEKDNETVITGKRSWSEWTQESKWDLHSFYKEQPDQENIDILKSYLKNRKVYLKIFASSFCDECKDELPRIIKILHLAGLNDNNFIIYGLDHDVKEPSGEYSKYDIKNLPFIAVFDNDTLVNTITSPQQNWLKSIIKAINK